MTFQDFKQFVEETIIIVSADLDELQKIAEKGNETPSSSSLTFQSTIRPDGEYLFSNPTPKISRCTIPIAMICFSIIDMFGQWINDYNDDDFGHSSVAFFKKLAKKDDLNGSPANAKFKEQFRHGVIHSFFAKKGFSVTYPFNENNSLFVDYTTEKSTLDIKYLLKIVREGMENLKLELLNEQSDLSKKAFVGYQRWLHRQ
jgi:hypothetical protein